MDIILIIQLLKRIEVPDLDSSLDQTHKIKGSLLLKNAVGTVLLINMMLAVIAMLKDMFFASYLGTSEAADAFWLAFFIPDTFGNNLLGNSLAIACIPVFSKLCANNEYRRLKSTVTLTALSFLLATLLLFLGLLTARSILLHKLGFGLDQDALQQSLTMFVIMLPSILLFPAISIGTAAMQVHDRFNLPALAPVMFNFVQLTVVFYLYSTSITVQAGIYFLSYSIPVAAASMLVLIIFGLRKSNIGTISFPLGSEIRQVFEEVKKISKIFLPYLLIMLSLQVVYAVERYLASTLETGSIAALNYAFRIAQAPSWVFVAALITVIFPSMSKSVGLGLLEDFKNIFTRTLSLIFLITVPTAMCFYFLRIPIISILFQRGSFDMVSMQLTSKILAGFALGVVSQGVILVCLRMFLALGQTFRALFSFLLSASINITLDFILVEYLGSAGLGYGASIAALLNSILLLYLLQKTLKFSLKPQLLNFFRTCLASLSLLPVLFIFYHFWFLLVSATSFSLLKILYVLLFLLAVLTVYWWSLRILRVDVANVFKGGES